MRSALAAISVLTLLAVVYLSASLIVLRPPRADYSVWFILATVCAIQGGLTLWLLAAGTAGAATYLSRVALAGGCAIAAIGVWMVRGTLSSPHFEEYALVLGSMLVLQGALTIAQLRRAGGKSRALGT